MRDLKRLGARSRLMVVLACGTLACQTVNHAKVLDASSGAAAGSPATSAQYSRYLTDTLASLDMMRGATGLIKDSIWICNDADLKKTNFVDVEQLTSPTNIGLDIMILTERMAGTNAKDVAYAKAMLAKVLGTLSSIDYHQSNGLFFRTYWPDTGKAEDINLSSVDNMHLAFGLWVVSTQLATAQPALAAQAKTLFDRMDFSDYYNTDTGLIGGNMRPVDEDPGHAIKGSPQGAYKRDTFDYAYFGSEARSLYALGWAIGLYKTATQVMPDFDQRILGPAITGTIAEIASVPSGGEMLPLLRTWDGGGFQALLPAVLVREDLYSPVLGQLHKNYAKRLLNDSATFGVPAAHSASAFGVNGLRVFSSGDPNYDKNLPIYNGTAGHIDMVASMHTDISDPNVRPYWDIAYTPHPAFMAASFARDAAITSGFAAVFAKNESLTSPSPCMCGQPQGANSPVSPTTTCSCQALNNLPNNKPDTNGLVAEPNLCVVAEDVSSINAVDHLYRPGLGWMDGYYVSGPLQGKVVPVLISLDQSMIAVSLFSLLSTDGHYVGSRALANDPIVSARLQQAYDKINDKLAALTPGQVAPTPTPAPVQNGGGNAMPTSTPVPSPAPAYGN